MSILFFIQKGKEVLIVYYIYIKISVNISSDKNIFLLIINELHFCIYNLEVKLFSYGKKSFLLFDLFDFVINFYVNVSFLYDNGCQCLIFCSCISARGTKHCFYNTKYLNIKFSDIYRIRKNNCFFTGFSYLLPYVLGCYLSQNLNMKCWNQSIWETNKKYYFKFQWEFLYKKRTCIFDKISLNFFSFFIL